MPRTDTRMRTQAAAVTATADRYYARRPFLYAGTELERGQVFSLAGAANDEKLIRIRYIDKVEDHHEIYECGECRRVFVHMGYRDLHGKEAHRKRPRTFATPMEEDSFHDRQEAALAREAPLALEKTLASQRAS
jgi:hypothetical protein